MDSNYGIDAPGVRRGMLIGGIGGAVLAAAAAVIAERTAGPLSVIAAEIAGVAGVAAFYGLGMAAYMTHASRAGKLRTRERLLDLTHAVAPWTGREAVLDLGCGRGLMMVGAARRLTTGKAVGVDLSRAEDQTDNTPAAALENARREGVADRVSVETGDVRALPYADACLDVVLSHWVVHNLPNASDRLRALDEMLRVLKPGGVLLPADIAHHADYTQHLTPRGLTQMREHTGGIETQLVGALSGGSYRPQAIVGRRTSC